MPTKKHTVSVRLDEQARRRVEKAAGIAHQSTGAFLERAGQEQARGILLGWSLDRYRSGRASLSELAEETGLAVEDIVDALGASNRAEGLEAFLASCKSVAENWNHPEFLDQAKEAAKFVSAQGREVQPAADIHN